MSCIEEMFRQMSMIDDKNFSYFHIDIKLKASLINELEKFPIYRSKNMEQGIHVMGLPVIFSNHVKGIEIVKQVKLYGN